MSTYNESDKLDWMYKGATSLIDREDYLLGKPVDKPLEQLNIEERTNKLGILPPKNHVEHECIPPSLRDFNKIQQEQVDISAKLQEDPLVAIKKREEEARRQFLQNPIQLKKLQEALKTQEKEKRKKSKASDSEDNLDKKITHKLKNLKGTTLLNKLAKKEKKKQKSDYIDTILMHKFNQLKDKLSQKDLDDIMNGIASDSDEDKPKNKKTRRNSTDSDKNKSKNKKVRSSSIQSSIDSDHKYNDKNRKSKLDNKYKEKNLSKYQNKRDSSSDSEPRSSYRKKYDHKKENSTESSKYKKSRNNKKIKYKHRDTSSDSSSSKDDYRKKRNEKPMKSNDKKSSYKTKNEDKNKKDHRNNKKGSSSSSSEEDETDKHSQSASNNDLEKMILEKLRRLRDSRPNSNKSEKHNSIEHTQYDSSDDEYVVKKKTFGLVRSDGTRIPLKNSVVPVKNSIIKKTENPKPVVKQTYKKLSDKEKEELRKQMIVDAVKRDKERSDNLRKYRQENSKDENIKELDKNFIHRELARTQHNIKDVESSIKSKINSIQRSSHHMNSHFSKKY